MTLQSPPAFLQAGSYSALSDRLHLITATALRDSPAGHRARQGFYADRSPLYANPSAMNWTIGFCAGVIANTFTADGGDYGFVNPNNINGSFAAASPTQNRYDILGFQVKDNFYDSSGLNQVIPAVIQGANSAGTPVDPALPASFIPIVRAVINAAATTPVLQSLIVKTVPSMAILPITNNTERAALPIMPVGFTIWNIANARHEVADGVGGWNAGWVDKAGGLLGAPTNGAANVAFGGETMIDSNTFTHTQGRYEEVVFSTTFSLNAPGVAITRLRYVAGAGPATTGSTLMYEMLPTGSGSNNQLSFTRLLSPTFRALTSGQYAIGVSMTAAAGAGTGTANGGGIANRDLYVKDDAI